MSDLIEECIKRHERVKNTSREEIAQVIAELQKHKILDEEDMRYHPEKFEITGDLFKQVFYFLDEQIDKSNLTPVDEGSYFPELAAPFEFDGVHFIWRLLIGQGSCLQLYLADNWKGPAFSEDAVIHL